MRAVAVAALAAAAFLPQFAVAQGPVPSAAAVKWGPGPDFLPAGAGFAVLQGDPGKTGVYTIRLHLPDGFKFPAHFHPTDEHVTVLSGTFLVGMGDTVDMSKAQTLAPGGFITAPANVHHYAAARGETVLQVSGVGPFLITYAKASDDPRNAKPKP
ncbi:MAG TPA: cupin domain-containing protein [Gemmatimonadales bacterium]|nr:cupin domain-containing protein [Gemmatimonadales bacterium]